MRPVSNHCHVARRRTANEDMGFVVERSRPILVLGLSAEETTLDHGQYPLARYRLSRKLQELVPSNAHNFSVRRQGSLRRSGP